MSNVKSIITIVRKTI